MPRIRSIKPETWQDKKLAERLSRDARLLYIALWNLADEHSRLQGDPRYIKGQAFPYDDDLGLPEIEALLSALATSGRIVRYISDDDPYIYLPKLAEHQRLEPGKVASKLPAPPDPSAAQIDPDESARRPDLSVRHARADESAPHADRNALLYVAGSMEPVAGSMGSTRDADEFPEDPTGRLLGEHASAYAQVPPPSALEPVKREIMRLVAENVPADRIRSGLERMREKRLAASLLPQLVTETNGRPSPSRNEQILDRAMQRAEAAEAEQARKALP